MGSGAYATTNGKFRSLLIGVNRGSHFVYVGRVGTGYGAGKVDVLLPKLRALETAKSPFTGIGAPKKDPNIVWVKPELVAEIEFAGWLYRGRRLGCRSSIGGRNASSAGGWNSRSSRASGLSGTSRSGITASSRGRISGSRGYITRGRIQRRLTELIHGRHGIEIQRS